MYWTRYFGMIVKLCCLLITPGDFYNIFGGIGWYVTIIFLSNYGVTYHCGIVHWLIWKGFLMEWLMCV